MEIIQNRNWWFELKNWPRSIKLDYNQVEWILEDFYDMEFDIPKAKEFYNLND